MPNVKKNIIDLAFDRVRGLNLCDFIQKPIMIHHEPLNHGMAWQVSFQDINPGIDPHEPCFDLI